MQRSQVTRLAAPVPIRADSAVEGAVSLAVGEVFAHGAGELLAVDVECVDRDGGAPAVAQPQDEAGRAQRVGRHGVLDLLPASGGHAGPADPPDLVAVL